VRHAYSVSDPLMPADRLRRQLAELTFPVDDDTRIVVQRRVYDYVDWLKAQNWPPERVIVSLKLIAEESGIRSSLLPAREGRASRSDLLMDMVAWSIERYYAADSHNS
jgi:hypothetical protein